MRTTTTQFNANLSQKLMNLRKHLFFSNGLTTTIGKKLAIRVTSLISGNKTIANINNNCIESEDIHKLLGIIIDSNLPFENHINKFWKKASKKLNPLAQISTYMT